MVFTRIFISIFFLFSSHKQRSNVHVTPATLPSMTTASSVWHPTPEWVASWRVKLPLQTIMRLLQVLVPQVEKICIDK